MSTIDKQVAEILKDIKALSFSDKNWRAKEDAVWKKVEALNTKDGLGVGKHIQFQVADGHAHYIVTKVLAKEVVVVHLPIGDAWHFAGAYADGKTTRIPRKVAERVVIFEDSLKELFSKPFVPLSQVH